MGVPKYGPSKPSLMHIRIQDTIHLGLARAHCLRSWRLRQRPQTLADNEGLTPLGTLQHKFRYSSFASWRKSNLAATDRHSLEFQETGWLTVMVDLTLPFS